jgi:hypothetical protein
MDAMLIGYLLDALDPDERRTVEDRLRSDPQARTQLSRLRSTLAPLDADSQTPPPPTGLVERTLAHVAALSERGLPQAPHIRGETAGAGSWFRRIDILAAAVLLLLLGGLGTVWLSSKWQQERRAECAANLMVYWRSLETYGDHHDGQFPRIDAQGPANFAGSFISFLNSAGTLSRAEASVLCPAEGRQPPDGVTLDDLHRFYDRPARCEFNSVMHNLGGSYAYSLGYWKGPVLCGLRQGDNLLPIMADRPSPRGGNSLNHGGGGQNVLYVGGHVIWHTTTFAGPDGDDIFCNRDNRVLAGVDPTDAVLGPSDATPTTPD